MADVGSRAISVLDMVIEEATFGRGGQKRAVDPLWHSVVAVWGPPLSTNQICMVPAANSMRDTADEAT